MVLKNERQPKTREQTTAISKGHVEMRLLDQINEPPVDSKLLVIPLSISSFADKCRFDSAIKGGLSEQASWVHFDG